MVMALLGSALRSFQPSLYITHAFRFSLFSANVTLNVITFLKEDQAEPVELCVPRLSGLNSSRGPHLVVCRARAQVRRPLACSEAVPWFGAGLQFRTTGRPQARRMRTFRL